MTIQCLDKDPCTSLVANNSHYCSMPLFVHDKDTVGNSYHCTQVGLMELKLDWLIVTGLQG